MNVPKGTEARQSHAEIVGTRSNERVRKFLKQAIYGPKEWVHTDVEQDAAKRATLEDPAQYVEEENHGTRRVGVGAAIGGEIDQREAKIQA